MCLDLGVHHVSHDAARVAYLTNIPSPYRAVMIRAWAQQNPNLRLSVFYTDADDQGRGWSVEPIGEGVAEQRLPIVASIKKYGKLNRRLWEMVRAHDVIMIGGFEQASYLVAALLARAAGKPVILLFDGFSPARFGTEPLPIVALKRFTAYLSNGFFANGTVGRRYLTEQIGVPRASPIYNQFLSHSQAPIEQARRTLAEMDKDAVRRKLGIGPTDRPIVMSCGYLIQRKRNDLIVAAIARMPEPERPLLLVVGSGPLTDALQAQAMRQGVETHFAGFRQGSALAEYYFAADALVLASSDDPWGLVVNEAMSAGLPIVASDACGAALDLVQDGINGFVFATGQAESLERALSGLLRSDRASMGAASQSMIASWTPLQSAQNLGSIVAIVTQGRAIVRSKGLK